MLLLAVDAIDAGGEGAVRVSAIATRAGPAVTSLYHHFGSREGLVEAAQAERFLRGLEETIAEFADAASSCPDTESFREILHATIARLTAPERAGVRMSRANAVGSAFRRPDLARRIALSLQAVDRTFESALGQARDRGFLRPGAVLLGSWYLSLVFGRVLGDFDPDAEASAGWLALTLRAVDSLLFDDEGGEVEPAPRPCRNSGLGPPGDPAAP